MRFSTLKTTFFLLAALIGKGMVAQVHPSESLGRIFFAVELFRNFFAVLGSGTLVKQFLVEFSVEFTDRALDAFLLIIFKIRFSFRANSPKRRQQALGPV